MRRVRVLLDAVDLAGTAVRARPARSALTAAGIAVGIAAMIAVLGISASSRAQVLSRLDGLGTAYLRATAVDTAAGPVEPLPAGSAARLRRLPHIEAAAATAALDAIVRRTDLVSPLETNALTVRAAEPQLLGTLRGGLQQGRFVQDASLPEVVVGAVAADRLGIDDLGAGPLVHVGDQWLAVVGVLDPLPLAADLDSSVLVSWPTAESLVGEVVAPRSLWVRADHPDVLADLRGIVAATLTTGTGQGVEVSRPSDLVEAWAATDTTFTGLLLGLGAVALLVGGIGIANVQVIAVLERRTEVGIRRAMGATRVDIGLQFVAESAIVSLLGALAGVGVGAVSTAAYATRRGWPVDVPTSALAVGIGASLLVGIIAGIHPARRAARLAPVEAIGAA